MKYYFTILILVFSFTACKPAKEKEKPLSRKEGIVRQFTYFYKPDGTPRFSDTLTIWYQGDIAIEEIKSTNTYTDEHNVTTVTKTTLFFRYMDLRTKQQYDYLHFSDTAKINRYGVLPDSLMDIGWSFYSPKACEIEGTPELLSDTTIEAVTYKRAKIHILHENRNKSYTIGYFRCDGKGIMFSMEKAYSSQLGCTLVKTVDYRIGETIPAATLEVRFISDTLPTEALRVLTAWKKIAAERPAGE